MHGQGGFELLIFLPLAPSAGTTDCTTVLWCRGGMQGLGSEKQGLEHARRTLHQPSYTAAWLLQTVIRSPLKPSRWPLMLLFKALGGWMTAPNR